MKSKIFSSFEIKLKDFFLRFALRVDASRGPATETKSGGERAHEQPKDSDRTAKSQRRRSPVRAHEGLCYTRPSDEHAIWPSELSLKGASGGQRTRSALFPTCEKVGVI